MDAPPGRLTRFMRDQAPTALPISDGATDGVTFRTVAGVVELAIVVGGHTFVFKGDGTSTLDGNPWPPPGFENFPGWVGEAP